MRIFVDADACPVVGIVEEIAKEQDVPVTLLCDTNHILSSDYSDIVVVGAGADFAIHQSGKWYTDENIDQLLIRGTVEYQYAGKL